MVSEAYEILSDSTKRQEYNQELEAYEESLRQKENVAKEPVAETDETTPQYEDMARQFSGNQVNNYRL